MEIKAAVVTASDSRVLNDDISGTILVGLLIEIGAQIVTRRIVSDDTELIQETLLELTQSDEINLILTTGGTGFSPRDNMPEATLAVIEREAHGIAEAIRYESAKHTPFAMLSRGVAGINGSKLLINLPGSPTAVTECFEVIRPILFHAIDLISGETKH